MTGNESYLYQKWFFPNVDIFLGDVLRIYRKCTYCVTMTEERKRCFSLLYSVYIARILRK